jgi:hypothetical protein
MTAEPVRGWAAVAGLALVTALMSVVQPALLMFVPLGLLFIALPPRRPLLLALGAFIGWLAFRAAPGGNTLWYFERGWALLLGAWFVVFAALRPGWRFLSRALCAVAATAATAAVLLVASRGGLAELDTAVAEHLEAEAAAAERALEQMPALGGRAGEYVTRASELSAHLFPALLALSSLAALGVAWWAYGRVAGGDRQPLGRLREFRFSNELIWLLIAGLLLLVLPLNALTTRAGANLLAFMAVLYALRGAGVMLVVVGLTGPLKVAIAAVVIVLLYPYVMATAIIVGLSDTWLDIRARRAAPTTPGS